MLPVPVTLTTRFIACLIISSRGSLLTFTRHCYWEGEHPNMYMYIFYTYTYTRNTYMQNIYIQSSTYCFCFQKNNARNISHWEPSWFGGTHQGLKCGGKVDLQTHEWWLNCEPHQLVISRLKAWKDKANCQSIREVTMGMSNYTKQFWTKSPPLADIPLILKYSKTASALWPVHSRKATTWDRATNKRTTSPLRHRRCLLRKYQAKDMRDPPMPCFGGNTALEWKGIAWQKETQDEQIWDASWTKVEWSSWNRMKQENTVICEQLSIPTCNLACCHRMFCVFLFHVSCSQWPTAKQ